MRLEVEPFLPLAGCNMPSAISTEPLSMWMVFGRGRVVEALFLSLVVGFRELINSCRSITLP